MSKQKGKASDKLTPNEQKMYAGIEAIKNHPLFGKLRIDLHIASKDALSKGTAAVACQSGDIIINKYESRTVEEWIYLIAHCMLHLCFGHFETENMPGHFEDSQDGKRIWIEQCDRRMWNMACDIYIARFLADIKLGSSIGEITDMSLLASDEKVIYEKLLQKGINSDRNIYGTARPGEPDMRWNHKPGIHYNGYRRYASYSAEFAYALADSVHSVINKAGGRTGDFPKSVQQIAAEWFINHYPLLGGLASGFKVIEVGFGSRAAHNSDISIAAINVTKREIYVNSAAKLTEEEWRFVLAHEYLHAGLQHHERCQGRNPYLWNVACDFVINGWLKEMQIGSMPMNGLLYDEEYQNFSAEEIYDILVKNMRKNSKLDTFRGYGMGDILDEGYAESKLRPTTLDDFCKSALRSGLEYHQSVHRGYIPAGLIEEIKALSIPPIPWDVELARWFDMNFAPLEKHRTYARPSRRQSSTPDIPCPRYVPADVLENSRTYAVIIDTSGSMSAKMIGMALGAAANYSVAKEVPLVRVVFCDAQAYDIGYVAPDDMAGRVEVRGRGGTVLQPAVDLLERAKDFPKDGPLLIITDGFIEDHLEIHREHAFLIPKGHRLPFRAKGKVFYFGEE